MATDRRADPQLDRTMDPVCGLRVGANAAFGAIEYGGRQHYFRSADGKAECDANPERFARRG
jgi:YHS domain-containing protein